MNKYKVDDLVTNHKETFKGKVVRVIERQLSGDPFYSYELKVEGEPLSSNHLEKYLIPYKSFEEKFKDLGFSKLISGNRDLVIYQKGDIKLIFNVELADLLSTQDNLSPKLNKVIKDYLHRLGIEKSERDFRKAFPKTTFADYPL